MKWIISIFLMILLSYVNILNAEDKAKNEKSLQKMLAHMTKIRNFLRNLEEDTGDEDGSLSENHHQKNQEVSHLKSQIENQVLKFLQNQALKNLQNQEVKPLPNQVIKLLQNQEEKLHQNQ